MQMEARMSLLSSLEIVPSVPRANRLNGITAVRQKLIDRINDQIELVRALDAGEVYQRSRYRRYRDLESGDMTEVPTKTRVRPWWAEMEDGSYLLTIKYGNQALELQKSKAAIKLATRQDIASTLELVRAAVRAGEFDAQIMSAVKSFQARFKK